MNSQFEKYINPPVLHRLSIVVAIAMIAGGITANAETWPEVKTPSCASTGVEKNTEYLYMLDGAVFTVWRAPLEKTSETILRGRDRAYEDEMYTRWAHGVITPNDYAYIRDWMVGVPDQNFGASSIPGSWGGPTPDYELILLDGSSEYFGVPEQMVQAALLHWTLVQREKSSRV